MGIRQASVPLGVGLGALVIPRVAEGHGVSAALLFPAAVCALSAVACLLEQDHGGLAVVTGGRPRLRRIIVTWPA